MQAGCSRDIARTPQQVIKRETFVCFAAFPTTEIRENFFNSWQVIMARNGIPQVDRFLTHGVKFAPTPNKPSEAELFRHCVAACGATDITLRVTTDHVEIF